MKIKPWGLISDTHNHNWSSFSTAGKEGINSRLQIILHEFERVAEKVHEAGGNMVIHAGDMFHVRGKVAPSVLNPTKRQLELLGEKYGITWVLIPGNHDMEMKESSWVGNAIQSLGGPNVIVVTGPTRVEGVVVVPWHDNIESLKAGLEAESKVMDAEMRDLVIHAPVDGVLAGIPEHGLTADYLGKLGFRRVFSGHYHHHKDFGNAVYSIGAIAHHTWSDVGSKAGFMVIHDDDVHFYASHAPQFVDIHGDTPKEDVPLLVDGNYVRAKVTTSKVKDINALREWLEECGAKGVVINTIKEPARAREGAVKEIAAGGASMEVSINAYIKSQDLPNGDLIATECEKILLEASS